MAKAAGKFMILKREAAILLGMQSEPSSSGTLHCGLPVAA